MALVIKISFKGTRSEILDEMEEYLESQADSDSEPAPTPIAGQPAIASVPKGRRGRKSNAQKALEAQTAANVAGQTAGAPAAPTPAALPAGTVRFPCCATHASLLDTTRYSAVPAYSPADCHGCANAAAMGFGQPPPHQHAVGAFRLPGAPAASGGQASASYPVGTPGAVAPSAPAPVEKWTIKHCQDALIELIGKTTPETALALLNKEFGVGKAQEIPAERREAFIMRCAQLTDPSRVAQPAAPPAPTAANLL